MRFGQEQPEYADEHRLGGSNDYVGKLFLQTFLSGARGDFIVDRHQPVFQNVFDDRLEQVRLAAAPGVDCRFPNACCCGDPVYRGTCIAIADKNLRYSIGRFAEGNAMYLVNLVTGSILHYVCNPEQLGFERPYHPDDPVEVATFKSILRKTARVVLDVSEAALTVNTAKRARKGWPEIIRLSDGHH